MPRVHNTLSSSLNDFQIRKYLSVLGHVFFWVMMCGCVVYAPERMLVCDAGYYTFHVINYETYYILHDRYINLIIQSPALAAIKLGGSLRTVLSVYSVTAFVFFYAIFNIIHYYLKEHWHGLLLILALILTMRYKHYAGHTEITCAIAVAILAFSWVSTEVERIKSPLIYWGGLTLIASLLYVIHPIIVVPLMMMFGANVLYHNRWSDLKNWASIGLLLFAFVLKFYFEVFNNEYESGKVSKLNYFFDIIEKPSDYQVIFSLIKEYLFEQYYLIVPVFIFSLGLLFKSGKKLTSLYFLFCSLFILGLNITIHSYLRSRVLFMLDGYMGMLGMVFGLAMILAFRQHLNSIGRLLLFTIMIAWCVHQIEVAHLFFERRLEKMDKTFEMNNNHPLLFVELKDFNWEKMWFPFEVPLESMIWTSLRGKEHSKTIYVDASSYTTNKDVESINGFYMFDKVVKLNDKFFQLNGQNYKITSEVGWRN